MESIIELVSNVGFPIAITLYLLIGFRKTLQNNTTALTELSFLIKTMTSNFLKKK